MSDKGPSWWCTRTCTSPDDEQKIWFILFEFFQQNSQEYAFLRVSLCDGIKSQDAFFSHDEIFSRYGYGLSANDTQNLSQSFRNVVDQIDPGFVSVVTPRDQLPIVEISGEKVAPTIRLTMREHIHSSEFVDRVTKYMIYVDALVESTNRDITSLTEQKDQLLEATQNAAKAKKDDDESLTQGMRMLLKAKWDYWQKQ